MPPQPGQGRVEAPQEVVTLLVRRGGGEAGHPHVPGVERGHQSLDGAPLARGVPALEQHAHRRAQPPTRHLAAVDEPQLQQAALAGRQAALLLGPVDAQVEVDVVELDHASIEAFPPQAP